jgi:hypothetical protein
MYCNFILNEYKLDFSQKDITNSNWQERIILSILLVKQKTAKESNNDGEVTISATKMAWNHKQKKYSKRINLVNKSKNE